MREVSRLPEISANVLRVLRARIEAGAYATGDAISLARGLAATLEADAQIGPLQVLLSASRANGEWEPLDGKVIALSDHEGVRTALVRFTGIGWEGRERIDAFAAEHQVSGSLSSWHRRIARLAPSFSIGHRLLLEQESGTLRLDGRRIAECS